MSANISEIGTHLIGTNFIEK